MQRNMNVQMPFEFVIFDMDGVLLDSEPLHLSAKLSVLKSFGVEGVDCTGYAGIGNIEFWNEMKERFPVIGFSTPELLDAQYSDILRQVRELHIPPMDGTFEVLDALKAAGLRTGLASASHEQLVYPVLELLGLREYFEAVTTGSEIRYSKPDSEIYRMTVDKMGVDPARGMAVEDTGNGIISAHGAGLKAAAFMNPASGKQDYSNADWKISRLQELVPIALGE